MWETGIFILLHINIKYKKLVVKIIYFPSLWMNCLSFSQHSFPFDFTVSTAGSDDRKLISTDCVKKHHNRKCYVATEISLLLQISFFLWDECIQWPNLSGDFVFTFLALPPPQSCDVCALLREPVKQGSSGPSRCASRWTNTPSERAWSPLTVIYCVPVTLLEVPKHWTECEIKVWPRQRKSQPLICYQSVTWALNCV